MAIHYEIKQDPETLSYIMILEYAKDRNLQFTKTFILELFYHPKFQIKDEVFSGEEYTKAADEREERRLRLKEARKLKAKEVDQEWRWRCWIEDYQYYLEHDFDYRDFNEIMKLPFLEDRIFYLDKLLNNEVRAKDLIIGDATEKDVVERKKVVTWGENTVHEFKERRTRREKLWRFIKKVVAKLGERKVY
ncbi:hypothetical protein Glove_19g81 [Diversispora epigaea]|uniref:Uncharacterized protein n=1 Tax=Diversispora epigaea TaxID=1348612 RepID=A0A397JP22_9GLOM|nr:hypothetical protein Glove_19g81 [Diversispora epigaea]